MNRALDVYCCPIEALNVPNSLHNQVTFWEGQVASAGAARLDAWPCSSLCVTPSPSGTATGHSVSRSSACTAGMRVVKAGLATVAQAEHLLLMCSVLL